jgi:hypothetical protein
MRSVRRRTCRSAFIVAATVAAGAVMAIGATASAGVVVVSRESQVSVVGDGKDRHFVDIKTFNDLGNFVESVSGQEGDAPDGTYARGSASQHTTVTFTTVAGGRITGFGSLATDVFVQDAGDETSNNGATAYSVVKVTFQVTGNDEPFHISGEFESPESIAGLVQLDETSRPPDGSQPIFFRWDLTGGTTFDSGIISLRPATYVLDASLLFGTSGIGPAGGDPHANQSGLKSFNFTVGGDVEPPPTPIPLPAGVWAGMVGLTAATGAVRQSRRR